MIANAGIPSKAGGLDDRLENWRKVVDVDFSGAYYCARAAGEIFRKQGSGNVIFTASMSGHAANISQQQVSCPFLQDNGYKSLAQLIFGIGVLQCLQSWRDSSREVSGSRVGGFRKSQLRQPWVH